jgi:hypothetical protein
MSEVSAFRLYILRATYLLLVVGQAFMSWPRIVNHTSAWALRWGDTASLLAGLGALAALGIRYPLKMLPLLLFELTWKSIWMIAIALPLWQASQIDAQTRESIFAVGMGLVIMPIAIPWPYVLAHFVRQPGDRWR